MDGWMDEKVNCSCHSGHRARPGWNQRVRGLYTSMERGIVLACPILSTDS